MVDDSGPYNSADLSKESVVERVQFLEIRVESPAFHHAGLSLTKVPRALPGLLLIYILGTFLSTYDTIKIREVVNAAELFAPDFERFIGAGVDAYQLVFFCVYLQLHSLDSKP